MALEKVQDSERFNIKNIGNNFDKAEPTSDKSNSKNLTQVRPVNAAYFVKSCSTDSATVPGGNTGSPFLAYKEYVDIQVASHKITNTMPVDGMTIPSQTNGDEVIRISYTPTSANSKLLVRVDGFLYQCLGGLNTIGALFQDNNNSPKGLTYWGVGAIHFKTNWDYSITLPAESVQMRIYKFRMGPDGVNKGTLFVGATGAGANYGCADGTPLPISTFMPRTRISITEF